MIENGNTSAKSAENGDKPADKTQDEARTDETGLSDISELADALTEQAGAEEQPGDGQEPELDPLEQLAAENGELQDKLLRAAADMENLRRRTERERAEATLYAATAFARDMLNVSDNMDRALGSVGQEQRQAADEITRTLLDGVELVQRELMNIFEKHGIRRIEPLGERFDPNLHQAMFEIPDPDTASGTVVQVVQPGFVIGERVWRPAMVGVAKGGAKPEPKASADTGQPQADNDSVG